MTMHNLRFYQNLMQGLRDAIDNNSLDSYVSEFLHKQSTGIL